MPSDGTSTWYTATASPSCSSGYSSSEEEEEERVDIPGLADIPDYIHPRHVKSWAADMRRRLEAYISALKAPIVAPDDGEVDQWIYVNMKRRKVLELHTKLSKDQIKKIDRIMFKIDQPYLRLYMRNMVLEIVKKLFPKEASKAPVSRLVELSKDITDKQFINAKVPSVYWDIIRDLPEYGQKYIPLHKSSPHLAVLLKRPGRGRFCSQYERLFKVAYGRTVDDTVNAVIHYVDSEANIVPIDMLIGGFKMLNWCKLFKAL
ncbi:uncharacterized protein GIQ15_05760 [Arthroderma uncinatum]|uniref:uncharacterized protein n=1 Tax=Arthroderma uncinatum TaxID=74035 RepID=UPI00144ACD60|nr:uncharacterized protein GIQ15_05760 [Arthroderma uncinatum]KAF3480413.1 hypothetical protein GIQ15_05760 [Arthroderma uncinatum]